MNNNPSKKLTNEIDEKHSPDVVNFFKNYLAAVNQHNVSAQIFEFLKIARFMRQSDEVDHTIEDLADTVWLQNYRCGELTPYQRACIFLYANFYEPKSLHHKFINLFKPELKSYEDESKDEKTMSYAKDDKETVNDMQDDISDIPLDADILAHFKWLCSNIEGQETQPVSLIMPAKIASLEFPYLSNLSNYIFDMIESDTNIDEITRVWRDSFKSGVMQVNAFNLWFSLSNIEQADFRRYFSMEVDDDAMSESHTHIGYLLHQLNINEFTVKDFIEYFTSNKELAGLFVDAGTMAEVLQDLLSDDSDDFKKQIQLLEYLSKAHNNTNFLTIIFDKFSQPQQLTFIQHHPTAHWLRIVITDLQQLNNLTKTIYSDNELTFLHIMERGGILQQCFEDATNAQKCEFVSNFSRGNRLSVINELINCELLSITTLDDLMSFNRILPRADRRQFTFEYLYKAQVTSLAALPELLTAMGVDLQKKYIGHIAHFLKECTGDVDDLVKIFNVLKSGVKIIFMRELIKSGLLNALVDSNNINKLIPQFNDNPKCLQLLNESLHRHPAAPTHATPVEIIEIKDDDYVAADLPAARATGKNIPQPAAILAHMDEDDTPQDAKTGGKWRPPVPHYLGQGKDLAINTTSSQPASSLFYHKPDGEGDKANTNKNDAPSQKL